jgi:glutamate synthase (NADPH/NADH) large chain
LAAALDNKLIDLAEPALQRGERVNIDLPVRNVNRTVGTMLGAEITKRYGGEGLPEDTINVVLHGSAGQSLGAFIPKGLTIRLYGDSNDYVGKGISGGRVILQPDEKAKFKSEENVIAGNVIGYGATSGEIFVRGVVGERFCVRNSGATAVVEGVGDHALEYMTGGKVLILGRTGRNLAAGMSGGVAYVLDLKPELVNTELVDLLPVDSGRELELKTLLSKFAAETGSEIAEKQLKNWDLSRFTLVLPRDYAKVLAAIAEANAKGIDVDKYVMEAVANG